MVQPTYTMPYQNPPANNVWFGNNYSSGYQQQSRRDMNTIPYMQMPYGMMGPNNQIPTMNNILRVMGPRSAQEYQVGPNSHVVLMDSNNPIIYQKQSDDSGYSETKAYEIREIPMSQLLSNDGYTNSQFETTNPNYVTRDEFEEFKKSIEEPVMNNA